MFGKKSLLYSEKPTIKNHSNNKVGYREAVAASVMLSGGLCLAFIFTAIAPVLSLISRQFGGEPRGDIIAQLMMTLPSIGIIIGGPVVGLIIERLGARLVLLGSLATFGLAGCIGIFIENAVYLLVTRWLLGVAGAGIATTTNTLIGNYYAGQRRAYLMGYWAAIGAVGGIVSILCAGALGSSGGWHAPFALYGVAFILLLFALISIIPDFPARVRPSVGSSEADCSDRLSALWPIYISIVPFYVVFYMTGIQISFLLAANGIEKPDLQSWIISAASVGAIVGSYSYGRLQQKLSRSGVMGLSLGLMAVGNIVMGSQMHPVGIALGCLCNGVGGGMGNPYFANLLTERTPVALRGRALGMLYTMMFLGEFANPLIVTPLRFFWGISSAFLILGGSTALVATHFIVRNVPRR